MWQQQTIHTVFNIIICVFGLMYYAFTHILPADAHLTSCQQKFTSRFPTCHVTVSLAEKKTLNQFLPIRKIILEVHELFVME